LKLLLDTHILLWWLGNDPSLSMTASTLIRDPENMVSVSAVSLWEIRLKESLGKLRLPDNFEERLTGESFENLALTGSQTRRVAPLHWVICSTACWSRPDRKPHSSYLRQQ
jgi:PIN domain nuclease of toxin-antitoxin system